MTEKVISFFSITSIYENSLDKADESSVSH